MNGIEFAPMGGKKAVGEVIKVFRDSLNLAS